MRRGTPYLPYDAIVVGAGPAGSSAAYFLAREGLAVLVLERGPRAGSKTMSGGAIYADMIRPLFPQFLHSGIWEGLVKNQEYWLLTEDAAMVAGYHKAPWGREPISRIAVLRSRFDPWLARQGKGAGAIYRYHTLVTGLLRHKEQIVGVKTDGKPGELYGRVVLLAEGAYPSVALREGLHPPLDPKAMSLYVKETVRLPAPVLRERFRIGPGESVLLGFLGYGTDYLFGTSSLYTYREGFSLNVGTPVATMKKGGLHPNQFLNRLKNHPSIRPLFAGSQTVEYTARLIPEGGHPALPPRLTHDGALILGDSAGLVNGIQGINLAMFSGQFAAQAVVDAHNKGDFRRQALSGYEDRLHASFVMKNLKANRKVPGFYSRHPDLHRIYIPLAERMAAHISSSYPVTRNEKRRMLYKAWTSSRPLLNTLMDLFDFWRTVR